MSDEETDSEEPSELPDERVSQLLERVSDEARKLGLFFRGAIVHEDATPEDEREGDPLHHQLIVQFGIGNTAWSDRVQDPEAEHFKDQFRAIEAADIDEQIEAIRQLYRKPKSGA